jgi:predicted ribosome quality control (RQC) complex YloA/Tae2 family protein
MYEEALLDTERIQKYRLYGELLTANAHAVKKGAKEAALLDYYKDPPEPVIVPIDEKLSASANAQKYYKLYQKARTARDMAENQHSEALAELRYLEGQADNVSKCTAEAELNEIKDELTLEGYLRPDGRKAKAQKAAPSRPMHFISSDGFDIYVGKNNRQNDELTLKTAEPADIWLHTKEIPGSHVIIKSKGGEVPSQTLFEAACLAAWYSKARGGSQIPVDYTLRKFVKKPSGAKPGMVIYTNQNTAYITPQEGTVKRIRTLPQ